MATIGVDVRVLLDERQSGVAVYVRNILTHLTRLPGEATFRYYAGGWHRSSRPLPDTILSDRVAVVRSRVPNRLANLGMAGLGWPHLDALVGGVDRFFLPHVLFAAFSPRCPYVVTVHDLSFLRLPDAFSLRSRLWHASLRVGRTLRAARRIIALSEHTKRDVIELFDIPAERVVVIRSGLEPHAADGSTGVSARLGVRSPYLLVLGTLEPRKNPLTILEAFAAVRSRLPGDIQLVFIGGPGWSRVRDFERTVDRLGIADRVVRTGNVSDRDRDALLAGARLLLYPSLYEGFGFPILEAFAAGVPVVTSATTALPEAAGDGAMFADPNNVAEVSEAMVRVVSDPVLVERLTRRGRQIAAGYRWEDAAKRTLAVLVDS